MGSLSGLPATLPGERFATRGFAPFWGEGPPDYVRARSARRRETLGRALILPGMRFRFFLFVIALLMLGAAAPAVGQSDSTTVVVVDIEGPGDQVLLDFV